jgi:hypothetical protein
VSGHAERFWKNAWRRALLLSILAVPQARALAQSTGRAGEASAPIQAPAERSSESSPNQDGDEQDAERGESEEPIDTDRNSFTFSRLTSGANRLIVESSYSFLDLSGEKIKNSFPELVMRYGIGDRFELRLGWNYETGRERKPDAGDIAGFFGANAEQQIFYGFKAVVTRESGWMPGSALLAQGHTPTGGAQSVTQLRTGYVLGWKLPNRWDFEAAIRFGTDTDEGRPYVIWAPSAVLKIPLTTSERLFTHVEYFSLITNGKSEDTALHFVDTALHYLITRNIEVGGIIAFGPHSHGLNIVTNVGIGVRF